MAGVFGAGFQRWWGVATTLRPPVRSWVARAGPGGESTGHTGGAQAPPPRP